MICWLRVYTLLARSNLRPHLGLGVGGTGINTQATRTELFSVSVPVIKRMPDKSLGLRFHCLDHPFPSYLPTQHTHTHNTEAPRRRACAWAPKKGSSGGGGIIVDRIQPNNKRRSGGGGLKREREAPPWAARRAVSRRAWGMS